MGCSLCSARIQYSPRGASVLLSPAKTWAVLPVSDQQRLDFLVDRFDVDFIRSIQRRYDLVKRERDTLKQQSFDELFKPGPLPAALREAAFQAFSLTEAGVAFTDIIRVLAIAWHGSFDEQLALLCRIMSWREDEPVTRQVCARVYVAVDTASCIFVLVFCFTEFGAVLASRIGHTRAATRRRCCRSSRVNARAASICKLVACCCGSSPACLCGLDSWSC